MKNTYSVYIRLIACVALSLAECCGRAQVDTGQTFEPRYQNWRNWVTNHLGSSTYTTNPEYREIVRLGIPALPYIMGKMESNKYDFHLEEAVHRITKKRFEVNEWPEGGLGDSISASKMYLNWWKNDRKMTSQRFESLYQTRRSALSTTDPSTAAVLGTKILNLGIAALPDLVEKARLGDLEVVPFISKLTDGSLAPNATASEAVVWWEQNRSHWLLPEN